MMKYLDVKAPAWADADSETIVCRVRFDALPDYVPFLAMKTDPHAHGREIHAACLAGQYGEIGAYVPPSAAPVGE